MDLTFTSANFAKKC